MFTNFDPALLNDPQFKEDSVREVLIVPMLARLGYHSSGTNRVIRSKILVHPFFHVGTRKHPVKTIPDYTLLHEEKPILVLDAKSPTESVLTKENVQQAYSYAIHPEIRCQHFALCNGKALAVFSVDDPAPLLVVPFEDFESKWETIEKHLAPRFLLQPKLRKFAPDLGLRFSRMGFAPDAEIIMLGIRLGLFGRVSDELITVTACCDFASEDHCVSFDFSPVLLTPLLAGLPAPLAKVFREALARSPFRAHGDLVIEVDLKTHIGPETQGLSEKFVPLIITEVLGSRFNREPVPNEPTDVPPHIFRLSRVFKIRYLGEGAQVSEEEN